MKFSLNRKTIKAMLNLASKKDIRYYLQGICITQNNRGTYVDATDGYLLGRLLIDSTPMPGNQVILPTDALLKLKGTKREANEELHFTVTGLSVECISNDQTIKFAAYDAKFPDTDRVLNISLNDESKPSNINPDLLVRFVDFSQDLLGSRQVPFIYQRGIESSLVSFGLTIPEFIGVVMPIRLEHGSISIPEFCLKSKSAEQLENA